MPIDGRCTPTERRAIGQALFNAWRLPVRNAATEADMVCAALEDLWAEEAKANLQRPTPPAAASDTGEAPVTAAPQPGPAPIPLKGREKLAANQKTTARRGQPAARGRGTSKAKGG